MKTPSRKGAQEQHPYHPAAPRLHNFGTQSARGRRTTRTRVAGIALLGITPSYVRANYRGMAAVDQRIDYQRDLHAGGTVAIRTGVIEVREKFPRFVPELRNAESGDVCAVVLIAGVHMDTAPRKSCALPQAVVARAREPIVACKLPWQ